MAASGGDGACGGDDGPVAVSGGGERWRGRVRWRGRSGGGQRRRWRSVAVDASCYGSALD